MEGTSTISGVKTQDDQLVDANKELIARILGEHQANSLIKEPLKLDSLSGPGLDGVIELTESVKLINIGQPDTLYPENFDDIAKLMAMLGEEEARRYATWLDEINQQPELLREFQKMGRWYNGPSASIGWLTDYVLSPQKTASRMSMMTLDKRIIGASAHLGGETYEETVKIIRDNIRKYLYLKEDAEPWIIKQYEASIHTIESLLLKNLQNFENTSTAYIAQLFFSPDRAFPILESNDNVKRLWENFTNIKEIEAKVFHTDPIVDRYIKNLITSLPDVTVFNLSTRDQQYYLYRLLFTLNITVPILELKQQQAELGRGQNLQIATWTQTGIANDKMAQIFDLFFLLNKLGVGIMDKESNDARKYLYSKLIPRGVLRPLPKNLRNRFVNFGQNLREIYKGNVIDEEQSNSFAEGTSKHPGVYAISVDANELLNLFGDAKRAVAFLSFNPKYWKIMIASEEQ